jgi:Tol biopolymer transport system component
MTVIAVIALLVVGSAGAARPANGDSGNAAISGGGRFVAIASSASNLVRGDTNRVYDVFVRDLRLHTTERASVGSHGAQSNARTGLAAISGNGRFVVMWSDAWNLVAGDTNGVADVFVRDRLRRLTERVSLGPDGRQLATESGQAAISANGRYVAFSSSAQVFVRDRARRTTEAVGRGAMPALSASGRFLAFNDGAGQVVVRDRTDGSTDVVSVDSGGKALAGTAAVPTISANGRFVAFLLQAHPPDTPKFEPALYVRDRAARTTTLVARGATNPSISADGRTVAYEGGPAGSTQKVIVQSLAGGKADVVGAGTGPSFTGSGPLSSTGRFVAFYTATQVFVRDRLARKTTLVSAALSKG